MNAKTLLRVSETITEQEEIEQLFLNFDYQFIKRMKRLGCSVGGTPGLSFHAELEVLTHHTTFITAKEYSENILNYVKELKKFFKKQPINVEDDLMMRDRVELTILPPQRLALITAGEFDDVLGEVIIMAPPRDNKFFRIFIWPPSLRFRSSLLNSNSDNKIALAKLFIEESLAALETLIKALRLVEYGA